MEGAGAENNRTVAVGALGGAQTTLAPAEAGYFDDLPRCGKYIITLGK